MCRCGPPGPATALLSLSVASSPLSALFSSLLFSPLLSPSLSLVRPSHSRLPQLKEGRAAHERRYGRAQGELKALAEDVRRLQTLVEERHKLGAEHEKLKKQHAKKTGGNDEENDDDELSFDANGGVAYQLAHDKALTQLRIWSSQRAAAHEALYAALLDLQLAFFRGPQTAQGGALDAVASWAAPVANLKLW